MDDDEYLNDLMGRALEPVEVERYSNLPSLIESARRTLDNAKSSAEILEVIDKSSLGYTTAKEMGRISKARKAHDDVLQAARRLQGDAIKIENRAKIRLAEEYDAAQERGEVAGNGGNRGNQFASVENNNTATSADLGLRRDQIFEARKYRDYEKENPNALDAIVDDLVSQGQEPTKAAIRKEIFKKPEDFRVRENQEEVKLGLDDVVTPMFTVVSTWYREFDNIVTPELLAKEAWKRLSRNPDLRSVEQMAKMSFVECSRICFPRKMTHTYL